MAIWPLTSLIGFMKINLKREWSKMLPPWGHSFGRNIHTTSYFIVYCSFVYTAFPDFALDVSTEVEVGINCDDELWFHCIPCIWWERNTNGTGSRSLFIFHGNQIPCFFTTINTVWINGSSCLAVPTILVSISWSEVMLQDPKRALKNDLQLVEIWTRKSPCMRKYCSSQFTLCNISTSASSHSSSDMLCGSSGFRARRQCSLQLLRQSGNMPRPAPMDSDVEDGSPTTASKEFEAVCFKRSWWGVWWCLGFWVLTVTCSNFTCNFLMSAF